MALIFITPRAVVQYDNAWTQSPIRTPRRKLKRPVDVVVQVPSAEHSRSNDLFDRLPPIQPTRLPRLHARGTTDNFEDGENKHLEFKSLRAVTDPKPNFDILARACVGFANCSGGKILLGIEDQEACPPRAQRCPEGLSDVVLKKIRERTRNVELTVSQRYNHRLDAEYIVVDVTPSFSVASMTDGRLFKRVADQTTPVSGDDLIQLTVDRPTISWESIVSPRVVWSMSDISRWDLFDKRLKMSDKVHSSVQEKTIIERMQYYRLLEGNHLTQLGVLFLGTPAQRDALGTAPVVRIRRFNEYDQRVQSMTLETDETPVTLLDKSTKMLCEMCQEVFAVPHKLTRLSVQGYDEVILQEILVNALVHRPYNQAGDISVDLYTNRLEVTNPGALPLGVTPKNILHESKRRNPVFARIFDHLGFMERGGSGIDLMYERLLTSGRAPPRIEASENRVTVKTWPRIVRPKVVSIMHEADKTFTLSQRERMALALVSGAGTVTVEQFARTLSLSSLAEVDAWVENLVSMSLLELEVVDNTRIITFKMEAPLAL